MFSMNLCSVDVYRVCSTAWFKERRCKAIQRVNELLIVFHCFLNLKCVYALPSPPLSFVLHHSSFKSTQFSSVLLTAVLRARFTSALFSAAQFNRTTISNMCSLNVCIVQITQTLFVSLASFLEYFHLIVSERARTRTKKKFTRFLSPRSLFSI